MVVAESVVMESPVIESGEHTQADVLPERGSVHVNNNKVRRFAVQQTGRQANWQPRSTADRAATRCNYYAAGGTLRPIEKIYVTDKAKRV
jgi:hypothetical protein